LNGARLYNFVDNHDVERIMTKLQDKRNFLPTHVLLYTLPGIPSIYYGSEFGVEGRKERGSDASLRPCLDLDTLLARPNACLELITALGRLYRQEPALRYGEYRELQLTTGKFAFARGEVIVTVNNEPHPASFDLPGQGRYRGAFSGREAEAENGRVHLELEGNGGEIWIPLGGEMPVYEPVRQKIEAPETPDRSAEQPQRAEPGKPYEEMTVSELQAEILAKLGANGPVTDRMRREVGENVYRDSLLNWVRSFR